MGKHQYTNRLIHQKSPYLLQHAHNPVDWYSWGEDAFKAARDLDRPIFLSIGYATCHWCHVMEKESFEDVHIAKLLNQTFVNIKVDREELPEVDGLYMEFAQSMMPGSAGWPLNVVLTPELQPFFAATYLPPHNNHGMMGLTELIERIHEVWTGEEKEAVLSQAAQVVDVFAENVHSQGDNPPDKDVIHDVADQLFKMADPIYGGMKGTPKFPIGYQYAFLLRYATLNNDSRALFLVERSLDMMHRGGIFDHLGGAFSRYSVDEKWLIPHFEKMLYDNALLAQSYLEAWQVTKNPLYREVCESVLQYVLREMTHPDGGFYSAEDADSDGHEGLFYTWTPEEVKAALGAKTGKLFCDYYGITSDGNFEGRNVLHMKLSKAEFADDKGIEIDELDKKLNEAKKKLWQIREKRVHPFKDDKILSSWNGLMIYTMAAAGCAFNDSKYLDAAVQAATFIRENMWQGGYLMRRWREGEVLYNACLDEYAFFIRGILRLFEANCGTQWLDWAIEMTNILRDEYKADEGAFYQTNGRDENLILRKCQFADGAEPSGNAVHCENLLTLYQLTNNLNYLNQARDILKAADKYIESYAPGYSYHLLDLIRFYDKKAPTFVVALNSKEEWKKEIGKLLYSEFIPHKAIIWRHENDKNLFKLIPFVEQQAPIDGKTTLYMCYEGVCTKPLNDFSEMQKAVH